MGGLLDHEVGEGPSGTDPLGANARHLGLEVFRPNLGKVTLQRRRKGFALLRVDRVRELRNECRVGPKAVAATEVDRHMRSQPTVDGHRVDEVGRQPTETRRRGEVVAFAEMQSPRLLVDIDASELRDPIGCESGRVYDQRHTKGVDFPAGTDRFDLPACRSDGQPDHGRSQNDATTMRLEFGTVALDEAVRVHDPGIGRPEPRDGRDPGLDCANLRAIAPLDPARPVRLRPSAYSFERRDFILMRRYDQLPDTAMSDAEPSATLVQEITPFDAAHGFVRPGWIVEPAVDDLTVAGRGFSAHARILLDHHDALAASTQRRSARETHHARADDGDVKTSILSYGSQTHSPPLPSLRETRRFASVIPMQFALTEEQKLLRQTFSDVFAAESSPERVRRAEEAGCDPILWQRLAEAGVFGLRVPTSQGGSALGLTEGTILLYEAGRRLATGPIGETLVAARILAAHRCEELEAMMAGDSIVTFAPRMWQPGEALVVAGGSQASAALAFSEQGLVRLARPETAMPVQNLGNPGLARWSGISEISVLASGEEARISYESALEEWRLLTAAYLTGLAREALQIAASYATERIQFDRPIGAFQAIAHPLADSVTDVEAARLLGFEAIWAIANQRTEAGALVSMAYVWAALSATRAVRRSLHTHGGYGLSLEYDPQLYFRRAKAVALQAGDPRDELLRVTDRMFRGERTALPDAGEQPFDFDLGEAANSFRRVVRKFFEDNLTEELRAHAHFSWDGHHPEFNVKLAEAGLAFPSWPREFGGEERGLYEQMALEEEFYHAGWATHPLGTTRMVGATLMALGSEALKAEVLPRLARGEAITSLGFTEPSSGSDVAAAQTRAVRDGDEWVINGQKMFTSGANLARYVLLLTRTDPEAKKHRGLTMFLVPLDTPGIEIQPVFTISDERTNITYYSDVRVPDLYRIGEVNGGWAVLSHALEIEHAGVYPNHHEELIEIAVEWAKTTQRNGGPAMDDPRVRERLGLAATHFEAARVLSRRALWMAAEGISNHGEGPMAKLFQTEVLVQDAQDLLDLAAPDSLLAAGEPGAAADGHFENAYRFSPAPTIYAGTSEIMRSIIAQAVLGMPRSRS